LSKAVITHESWLDELTRLSALSAKNDEGLTLAEWAEKLGFSRDRMRATLGSAKAQGWLIIGHRTTESLDGRRHLTPVYRIVKPTKGGKK
jgi:predicted transcriptional regulator of viral defense system